ncbi:MAG: glycosyltransferase family 1 protein [Candidatus Gracilibacteria bacterium]|jgi:glycosyltransferase involved in cell wall biosynthesis|nr:glycosyltransferase family 1 protein [Candidatus Gracilibacteria bacterium]
MKIAINGRGLIKKYTGISVVTKNLTLEMAKAYPEISFLLVLSDKVKDDYSKVFPKNVEIKVVKEMGKKASGLSKLIFEQISFVKVCKKEKADIMFFPYPSNPWLKSRIFTAVIVHDAIPWKMSYNNGLLSSLYNFAAKKALKKADLIFTVSKFSKKDISKYANIPEESIKVVYNDAAEAYKKPIDEDSAEKLMQKIGVKKHKYFIYAGGYDERKNVKTLVGEFLKFSKNYSDIKLVLVGEKIFNNPMYSSFDEVKGNENIVFTGNISDEKLACLYFGALALVHLSKEEGYNLPIVEAGNMGTPLIISDIEVNHEIAGKSALYVDLENPSCVSDLMEKMLDEDFQKEAGENAKAMADQYLWERSALRYMDILLTSVKNER